MNRTRSIGDSSIIRASSIALVSEAWKATGVEEADAASRPLFPLVIFARAVRKSFFFSFFRVVFVGVFVSSCFVGDRERQFARRSSN